jgi:CBS domain-containing protein
MTTARDIMTKDPLIVGTDASVQEIARQLADEDIGAVMVCNAEKRLEGVVTDRDLAVEVVARGQDPSSTTAGDLVSGREVVTIGADDDIDQAIDTMRDHAVRRLPVIDGQQVVGVVSQADIARSADEKQVGRLIEAISQAPDNTGRG